MTNLDSILKSRDMILPAKVHLVKTTSFLFRAPFKARRQPVVGVP